MSLDVGIIGGGISGLSALQFLKCSSSSSRPSMRLFERSSRTGGWIHTLKTPIPGKHLDHVYETGPRSIRGAASGQVTLGLVSKLGLSDRLVIASSSATKRLVYLRGKVVPVPNTFWEAIQSPFLKYVPHLAMDAILRRSTPSSVDDESIAQFISRYWGPAITNDVVSGIVVGIYGGNIHRLSMKSCFPAFYAAAHHRGSFLRGLMMSGPSKSYIDEVVAGLNMTDAEKREYTQIVEKVKSKGPLYSFQNGIQDLIDTLTEKSKNELEMGTKVVGLAKTSDGIEVHLGTTSAGASGKTRSVRAKRLIACMPSHELAPLVADISPTTSEILNSIEFVDMAVVSFAFEEPKNSSLIPEHLRGFGYLVPPPENKKILGVSFDSISFPSLADRQLLRVAVMIGGDPTNNAVTTDVAKTSHQTLTQIALDALRSDLGITSTPIHTDVTVAENAIPQYTVGHSKRIEALQATIQRDLPQLHLAGASYHGVSVNDCALSGMNAAMDVLSKLKN